MRNVASANWLQSVTVTSDVIKVKVPFVSLDRDGALLRRPPEAPPIWPLRDRLASVAFLEKQYLAFLTRDRIGARYHVTESLLTALARRARERGVPLLVVILAGLQPKQTQRYVTFMERQQIDVVDCRHPKFFTREMRVPLYRHPNGVMNTHWATCLAAAMRKRGLPESAERTTEP
jgi:hypothetical protein